VLRAERNMRLAVQATIRAVSQRSQRMSGDGTV
jgi:hypothetical protein